MRTSRPCPSKLSFKVLSWWAKRHKEFPFAVMVSRKLRFWRVRKDVKGLSDLTTEAVGKDWRIYLFRTGDQRDTFIEQFHQSYDAHGVQWE